MNGTVKFSVGILTLILFACSREQVKVIPDTSYFPLESGSVSEFEVERTSYSATHPPEISTYLLRQTLGDRFTQADGQSIYPLNYSRFSSSGEWKLDSTTIQWKTTDDAFRQEGGLPMVVMHFPLNSGTDWNVNIFTTRQPIYAHATRTDKPVRVGDIVYPHTVQITRENDSTLLSRNKYIEIYAEGIGLVRKEKVFLKYCNTTDCLGKGIIASGWKEISILKSHTRP